MTDARMNMIKEYVDTLRQCYLNIHDDTDIDKSYKDGANNALNHVLSFCTVVDDLIIEVQNEQ